MQCAVSLEIEQSLKLVSSDSYVAQTKSVGRQIIGLVNDNRVLPSDLFDIVRHDHHTFVHVTNVAGYVTLLAKELGYSERAELEKIAVGGLLHDLGKRHIPRSILNKQEALTRDEWAIIREHPQRGYEELCHRENIDQGQLMMTLPAPRTPRRRRLPRRYHGGGDPPLGKDAGGRRCVRRTNRSTPLPRTCLV